MLMNPTTVASHRSDFCRYVASIDHWEWSVLMLTTGTLATQCYMICTLQEEKKKEKREGEKNSRLSKAPAASVSPRQIWYTGSKQSCVNSAWINHSLVFIALHFMLRPLFSLSVVHLCRSLTRGRCCKLDETPPDLLPPWSENEDEQPDSGGGPVLQYL